VTSVGTVADCEQKALEPPSMMHSPNITIKV
jgi:hypothetical protein